MSLADLLPPDVRSAVCNGMGPRGGLLFRALHLILVLLGVGKWFKEASDTHDLRYALGGTESDRDAADMDYLTDMLLVVDLLGSETLRGRYARWFSFKAFVAVQELGDAGPFVYRDRPLTIQELILQVRAG